MDTVVARALETEDVQPGSVHRAGTKRPSVRPIAVRGLPRFASRIDVDCVGRLHRQPCVRAMPSNSQPWTDRSSVAAARRDRPVLHRQQPDQQREDREQQHADARAGDPFGDVYFDTKTDGTFSYGAEPGHQAAFTQYMRNQGYNLSTAGTQELTNFGTRPQSAATATVEETEKIMAAEAAQKQLVQQ